MFSGRTFFHWWCHHRPLTQRNRFTRHFTESESIKRVKTIKTVFYPASVISAWSWSQLFRASENFYVTEQKKYLWVGETIAWSKLTENVLITSCLLNYKSLKSNHNVICGKKLDCTQAVWIKPSTQNRKPFSELLPVWMYGNPHILQKERLVKKSELNLRFTHHQRKPSVSQSISSTPRLSGTRRAPHEYLIVAFMRYSALTGLLVILLDGMLEPEEEEGEGGFRSCTSLL